MKTTAKPGPTPATWDAEALYLKAQRYAQRMLENESDHWAYALMSALSLEFLGRAALSNVHPALLAEPKTWASLYSALGFEPLESKFSPKSISISEVFSRINSIFPAFTQENEDFCTLHIARRNTELHSGDMAYEGVPGSTWQGRYFGVCDILLGTMGASLEEFFGPEEAEVAEKLIAAYKDKSAKAVLGDVEAHKKVWNSLELERKTALVEEANLWASRRSGHVVDCPACGSPALVTGEPVSAPSTKLEDDLIVETQEYLPNQFECVACGLKFHGLSRLNAVDLGERYKKTSTFSAVEFYAPEDPYAGFEDDNNEPF